MKEEDAIKLIHDLAARNGGKVSFRSFIEEAGIPGQRLRREAWFPGWNQLLERLGIETSAFERARVADDAVAAAMASLIEEVRRWPTEDECVREKKKNPAFPDIALIRRVKKSGKLYEILRRYEPQDEGYALTRLLAEERAVKNVVNPDSEDLTRKVQGYVYMLRYEKKYKIGFTNTPTRRFREVQIELPEETVPIHSIETDDPAGIEQYWHKRFAAKRIRDSEWFNLTADDVRAFKRRKYQ